MKRNRKNLKKLQENIEKYKPEGDFTNEENIENLVSLSGVYPINLVVDAATLKRIEDKYIPPIGDYDKELGEVVWFIPRKINEKKTKNGKIYWMLEVTDITNNITSDDTVIIMWSSWAREDRYINNNWILAGNVYNAKQFYDEDFLKKIEDEQYTR